MEFLPGSLVLAQSGSFPPWPAKIQRSLGTDQYLVTYYGSYDTEVVPSQALHPYDDQCKQRFCDESVIEKQCPAFKRAMKEIEENSNIISGPKTKEKHYVRSDNFKRKLKTTNKNHDFDDTRSCTNDDLSRFVLPGINQLEKKLQPENEKSEYEKSEYEKIREKNIAEREAALKASGLLEDIRSFRADYINPRNVKKSNPKTSKSSSDTVKCPQCSLRIHRSLIKTHRKFYHDTQIMLPGGMEITRDKGRKKYNFGFTKSKIKTRNMKKNGTSSKSSINVKNMLSNGDGLCSIQRRNNLKTNQIEVVELDKDEVIEIVDDDYETISIHNNKLPGDENEAIEIVDEEEDTFANNNKAAGMTMEITTADIVSIYASELKTSIKSGKVEVVTIAEDDNCESTVNHDKSPTDTRTEFTTKDVESESIHPIYRKPPSLNNCSLDVHQPQSRMGAQFRTSILSQTSYGSFKDFSLSERKEVPSQSEGVSTSLFVTNTGQESTLKNKVTDSSSEEEDLDCTQESSVSTRNVTPCNKSLGGRRLVERSRSH